MSEWRKVEQTDRGAAGHWFLMCPGCPMLEEKKRDSDSTAPIACMGGRKAEPGERDAVSYVCWHTTVDSVRRQGEQLEVLCRFNPMLDLWNHPGGKFGAPKVDMPLNVVGEDTNAIIKELRRGALAGTLKPGVLKR